MPQMPDMTKLVQAALVDMTGLPLEKADSILKTVLEQMPKTANPKEYYEWLTAKMRAEDETLSVVTGMFVTLLMVSSLAAAPLPGMPGMPPRSPIIKP